MSEPLSTVEALSARLGEALTGADEAMAEAALNDASALVRHYGLPWPDPASAPAVAVSVTLAAAERRMRNPEGFRMEMLGAYQYQRPASTPTGVALTPDEIRMLQSLAGFSGIHSVPLESLGGVL
ncbi:hypothetical protein E0L36_26605 [Streptomyces sp. AJS327]|uniref:hypothetical protein n=1 Tax=Streptomyces sp. AJS327 TaxID=2545265 RepID=UPI0015DF8167|nr:hypothetical protein [Streptomyces sp. AJS327]MBA0054292.1 hypothetical protein [Streptomyces sp. AJS327]